MVDKVVGEPQASQPGKTYICAINLKNKIKTKEKGVPFILNFFKDHKWMLNFIKCISASIDMIM